MENKFTQKAQNALILAEHLAQDFGHTYIGSEHLLLGLMEEKESIASQMLSKKGIVYEKIKNDVIAQTDIGSKSRLGSQNMTPRVRRIIENSSRLAEKSKHSLVGSEHLLYSLLSENDCLAVRILEQNGLYVHEMQSDILTLINASVKPQKSKPKDGRSVGIENFGRNMIELAISGKIDPTLCREKETERIIQILSRRSKNNPCLIGEPGVGKTAVVEGLACRIAEGNVPPTLKNKRLFALDVPALIAGAKYRGEFEDRMKNIMSECTRESDIILFIDEIHTIIGAGSAEGAIDAANILKPALARGEIQIIGATTVTEYRKHIERDSALERRFQPVTVNEPSAEDTEKILLGLRERYERHHGLVITDEAIHAAVELSKKYINDRFLPDKAIDLIDEASSRVKLKIFASSNKLQEIKNTLSLLSKEKENALLEQNSKKLTEIHQKEILLKEEEDKLIKDKKEHSLLSENMYVTRDDIARIVTDWSGVPVDKLMESESKKLLSLEKELKERIIGQDKAVEILSQAIRRGRIGLKSPDQPMGSFILIGPTGVGKTELCVVLAEILFGSQSALLRFDMSEFMEKHSLSKLIGAPPGYVGYGEGGILTERVRSKPYSIVLFDEIEKAHPEIFNILLQILEDGTLTDSQGRKVSFKNTLIVMTSNLGAAHGASHNNLGFSPNNCPEEIDKEREKRIKKALEGTFKPELLNRVDEVIIFNSLKKEDIDKICTLMLRDLSKRLNGLGIDIIFDSSVSEAIIKKAFDATKGARKLKREIISFIENPISNKLISGEITSGDRIRATAAEDKLELFKY